MSQVRASLAVLPFNFQSQKQGQSWRENKHCKSQKEKKLKTVFSDQSGLIRPALGVVLWGRNVIRNSRRMFPFRHDAK